MDIKDCKVGTRVVCVACEDEIIPIGAVGTIIENNTTIPWVSFDKDYGKGQKEVFLGYSNCKVMELNELEVLKESLVTEQDVLNRLLAEIIFATESKDENAAVMLSQAYGNIKSVQNI